MNRRQTLDVSDDRQGAKPNHRSRKGLARIQNSANEMKLALNSNIRSRNMDYVQDKGMGGVTNTYR